MKPLKIHIAKKHKNEAERKKYEARERAKQLLKGKTKSQLTRAEKDDLLFELCRMHGIFE